MHYLIIFLALLAPHGAVRVFLASFTIWMHESAAFTSLPLYFTIEWLYFGRHRTALATLALSLVFFIVIHTFFQTVTPDTITHYRESFLAHADYQPRIDYLQVFREEFTGKRFRPHTYFKGVEVNYAVFCLLLASILSQCCTTLKKVWSSVISATLIWLAAASPLIMGFFGWDCNRWIFLSLVNISVLFVLFNRRMNAKWRLAFLVAAFVFFFASTVPLFDMRHYRSLHEFIPFIKNLGSLMASIPSR